MNQPVQMAFERHAPSPDPLRAIARFGDRTARDGFYAGLIIALLSHTAALAFPDLTTWAMAQVAADMREQLHQYFWQEYDVVVDEPEELAKPESDEPEEELVEEPEPEPEPQAPLPEPEPEGEPDPPPEDPYASDDEPPPPSEAADIMTAPDDGPVDLTDEGFVDKDGSTNSGAGMVSAKGKGNEVVRNRHAKVGGTGDKSSKGAGKARRGSRKPKRNMGRGLGGSYRANCPFPPQADLHQVDSATVQLLVTVDAGGHVKSAQVLSDPGYGFGQQAKRCVMAQTFPPALDADGNPMTQTGTMNYRFKRR